MMLLKIRGYTDMWAWQATDNDQEKLFRINMERAESAYKAKKAKELKERLDCAETYMAYDRMPITVGYVPACAEKLGLSIKEAQSLVQDK